MKKLLSKLFSLFSSQSSLVTSPEIQKISEETWGKPEPTVELNLDTGKLILPDNISPEDRAELEQAIAELKNALEGDLQHLAPADLYKNFEDFLKEEKKQSPFTAANNLPEAQIQVSQELEYAKDDTDHWSDQDFIDALYSYYVKGYKFTGLVEIANKFDERLELSQDEKRQIREWYILASQEIVYEV